MTHPIENIHVSSEIIDCLLEEFNGIINSKRLQSGINYVGELIDALWMRNRFVGDGNELNTIFKYIQRTDQQDTIRNYIGTLNDHRNVAPGNYYGNSMVTLSRSRMTKACICFRLIASEWCPISSTTVPFWPN